jgi:hypothetical protein
MRSTWKLLAVAAVAFLVLLTGCGKGLEESKEDAKDPDKSIDKSKGDAPDAGKTTDKSQDQNK